MNTIGRPRAGPPRAYRMPPFTRARLPNGVEVIVAPFKRFPLATIRVVVDAGATRDAPRRAGESYLTAKSLLEGTARRSADEITATVERLGGELESQTDWNDLSVSTTIQSGALAGALAVVSEIVEVPSFPEAGVWRNRNEQLADREQARVEPRQHADDIFASVVYESSARFALPEAGDVAAIRTFERSTVQEFHRTAFTPERTAVIVVGDVDVEATVQHVRNSLGEWGPVNCSEHNSIPDRAAGGSVVHVVDKAGAAQTELRMGHVGIARRDPDYFAVVVMNSILGGLFSSRINLNLREKHGYTYGAFSSFDWRVQRGPFMISTAVQTDATAASISEIINEIDRIRQEPVSEDERSLAVNYLAGVFPIRYETTAAIASALAAMRVFGLPADYFETYRERILAVTAGEVLSAAQRHLNPAQLQIVALGDADAISATLDALGRDVVRVKAL